MISRVLIMAGGTGGHVFPALAVAQALQDKGVTVTWLGTQRGLEADVVPNAGFAIDWISIQGLRGKGALGWLMAPAKLLRAVTQAWQVFNNRKPDAVIGLGGFVTGPGGVVAWLQRKPLVIHEQNAIPGLTNRLLAKLASRVLEAFPGSFENKVKAVWVGNPVRKELLNLAPPAERFELREGAFRLLVVGGSLGARALNEFVPAALKQVEGFLPIQVWHQTGKQLHAETVKAYEGIQCEQRIDPFINDMAEAYAWADLVICRSGALTVSELAAVGVGSILVPFPHAVDDHQTVNAKFLVDVGASILMPQSELTANGLAETLKNLFADRNRVVQMAKAAYAKRKADSVDQVIDACYEVANV